MIQAGIRLLNVFQIDLGIAAGEDKLVAFALIFHAMRPQVGDQDRVAGPGHVQPTHANVPHGEGMVIIGNLFDLIFLGIQSREHFYGSVLPRGQFAPRTFIGSLERYDHASGVFKFIYPHFIEKTEFLQGICLGFLIGLNLV